jgi:hypothetical protein
MQLVQWLVYGLNSLQLAQWQWQNVYSSSGVCPASYSMGIGVSSQGVKWLEHEADHSAPSTVKVEDKRNYTSTPLICLHGVDMDNFLDSKGLVTFPSTYTTSQFQNNRPCLCFGSAQSNLLHPHSYSLLHQSYHIPSVEIMSLNNLRTKQYKQTDTI